MDKFSSGAFSVGNDRFDVDFIVIERDVDVETDRQDGLDSAMVLEPKFWEPFSGGRYISRVHL